MSEYCKVIIVDDEFIMRQGMKHMLEWEKEGLQIVGEASNGQEGLALVEKLKPHIVLADIVMPIIDGIEFSEIIGKRFPEIQLIMLSSYDKFEYVKTTLMNGASDYILKPTLNPEILLKTLKNAVDKIPGLKLKMHEEMPYAGQVEKYLLGYQKKLDEVTFVSFFPHTLYRMLAVNLRTVGGKHKENMNPVRKILEDHYAGIHSYVSLPVFLEEGTLCFVLNYRVKDELSVIVDAKAIVSRLERIYPRVYMVMSRGFSNMQAMKKHFEQDINGELQNAFYNPDKHLFIVEDYQGESIIKKFQFEAYTRHLIQGRYFEALEMFESYTAYICEMQMEEEKLKNFSKNLLYNFLMDIEKLSVESEALKKRYFSMLDNALWADDFKKAVKEITLELRKILESHLQNEDIRIIQIKQYVEQHYQESLDLSDIAGRFNFSYNYLSAYFSQNTKEGFNEFLNKIRVENACRLLRQEDMPIADIGNLVGYSEHSYFCRVFKKITGETPSNFRRREKQSL